ncbi:hypothetical protein NUW54_g13746 [Trametes sanguinea]|uniref:Uncharacterized protein n=1 Tax=Trametes sanguinea TaxID=158606 RepID=A0ACC1MHZ0_9APHY|nr:hypothetical protein NUW54_g13746 [Trametes sanguinea]
MAPQNGFGNGFPDVGWKLEGYTYHDDDDDGDGDGCGGTQCRLVCRSSRPFLLTSPCPGANPLWYVYVDFALVSCLQRYLSLPLVMGSYDIFCQYIKKLRARLRDEFGVCLNELVSIVSAELPEIIAAVGKYHLAMHTAECRHKFSLHLLPGAAMSDGETLERVWAITNAIAR